LTDPVLATTFAHLDVTWFVNHYFKHILFSKT
jgi:hypothetical protein